MAEKDNREIVVRLSLIDVIYGVVLAYGFTFFDQAKSFDSYFRFFFAYTVFIIDWVYVHRLYWEQEYKNVFLILDIGVLFVISRLLFTSTNQPQTYFLWLSVLFGIYLIWDIISKINKLPSQYDWRCCIAGDIFGCVAFFVFWIYPLKSNMQQLGIIWAIGVVFVYGIAFSLWLKKASRLEPSDAKN